MVLAALLLLAGLDDAPVEGSMVPSKSSGRFGLPGVTYHVATNAGTRVALLGGGPAAGAHSWARVPPESHHGLHHVGE